MFSGNTHSQSVPHRSIKMSCGRWLYNIQDATWGSYWSWKEWFCFGCESRLQHFPFLGRMFFEKRGEKKQWLTETLAPSTHSWCLSEGWPNDQSYWNKWGYVVIVFLPSWNFSYFYAFLSVRWRKTKIFSLSLKTCLKNFAVQVKLLRVTAMFKEL